MSLFDAFIYGLIQGLTEFLPVSSSGHLAVLPIFLHIPDPGVVFDLFMHIGTAGAVSWYFRKDLMATLFSWREMIPPTRAPKTENGFLLRNLVFATLASFALIFVLKGASEEWGRSTRLVAFNLIFFGILMAYSDRFKSKFDHPKYFRTQQGFLSGIFMGLTQAVAIFPGVSRSGITLTTARFLGISRPVAGEFSFMLTLPVIYAGALVHLLEYFKAPESHQMVGLGPIVVGLLTSFVVGIITVHYFLKALGKIGLLPFTIYRIILGLILIAAG